MLKIALLGYGKMGKNIEQIAVEKGHEIVLRITHENRLELNEEDLKKADVAIEFSNPESALSNILFCLKCGVPVLSGTTGWLQNLATVEKACSDEDGTFLYASNFSVGVNLFFELNKKLSALMEGYPEYNVELEETHHIQKKDAPSGTAITLAEQIIDTSSIKNDWINESTHDLSKVSIISQRTENVPGTHSVKYSSSIDDIEIIHTAHSRKGFASGAVLAAEFLHGRKGIFKMKDVLGL